MGRSKNTKPVKRVTIHLDDLVHAAIDGVFIVGDLFLGTGYTAEKANDQIQKYSDGNMSRQLMITEYVNATVRIINSVQNTQKKIIEGKE